jgi:succinate dehydrogenase / fumarate reductase flavoprotein subunit
MCNWAPKIIDLLDRMGVPFNRTAEGQRALRLFGGSLFKRTFFAGATTGQQVLYALDEQTRRYESEGKVNKFEFWDFLWPILHVGPNGHQCELTSSSTIPATRKSEP